MRTNTPNRTTYNLNSLSITDRLFFQQKIKINSFLFGRLENLTYLCTVKTKTIES